MEQSNKDKIIKALPELLEVTTYNALMAAELKSKNVFSSADESHLNSKSDLMERVKRFYEIIMTRTNGYHHLIACLKMTKQSRALAILKESWHNEPKSSPGNFFGSPDSPEYIKMNESVKRLVEEESIQRKRKRPEHSIQDKILSFNVRAPSKLFTGRSKELVSLNKAVMTSTGSTTVISQSSHIIGLGGIGKTELAKKFIHSIDFTVDNPLFDTVVWINAENDITAGKDFRTLATDKLCISTLNANGGEEEMQTVVDKIYRQLERRKTLIIFDNVENAELVDKYTPSKMQTDGDISILITSQESCCNFGNQIRLSGLIEADAIEFVKKGLGIPDEVNSELDSQILLLVNRLQCFPLAIDQAIAFIKHRKRIRQDYGPQDYMDDLNSNTGHIFSKHFCGAEASYKKTIYEIVTLTLKKIKYDECFGSAASNIIQLMAFMEPDNIPDTIFKQLYDDFTLDGALILLERYSIVAFAPAKKGSVLFVFVHRLVQDVVRLLLVENGEENSVLEQCLQLSEDSECITTDTVDHFISCWNHVSKRHLMLVKAYPNLPSKITNVLIELSRFNFAYEFATSQLDVLKTIFTYEDNASELVNLELSLGAVIGFQYKLEENEYLVSTINNARKYLSESNSIVLNLQTKLGNVLKKRSQFDEALKLYKNVYDQWKLKSDGKESDESLEVLRSIGELHLLAKKYNDAAKTFQYIINESKKCNLENYPVIIAAKCFLAMSKTCPTAALEEIQNVCEYGEQTLHNNHIVLILAKLNFAVCLAQVGRFSQALEMNYALHKQLLSIHGCDHQHTILLNQNIIECLIEFGDREDLLEKTVEVYDHFKRTNGENSYFTLSAYNTVGIVLCVLDMPEKALFIIENCLMSPLFLSRATASKLIQTKLYAALCLEKLRRYKEAFVYLEEMKLQISGIESANTVENNYWHLKIHEAYDRVKQNCQQSKSC